MRLVLLILFIAAGPLGCWDTSEDSSEDTESETDTQMDTASSGDGDADGDTDSDTDTDTDTDPDIDTDSDTDTGPERIYNCDDSTVTCRRAIPACEEDELPEVTDDGTCWSGDCVPRSQCFALSGCDACTIDETCVLYQEMLGPRTICVPTPAECNEPPTCDCMGEAACAAPYDLCNEGENSLYCSCPVC